MKAENKSRTSMSATSNSGPGQGQAKAKIGDPISLGLSSNERVAGGTAGKLRGSTGESTQRPEARTEKIKSDRGTFDSTGN